MRWRTFEAAGHGLPMTTDRPDASAGAARPSGPVAARLSAVPYAASPRVDAGRPWLAVLVAGLAAFVYLTVLVASHVPIPFDQAGLAWAHGLGVPASVWGFLSETANIPLIVIGVLIVGRLLLQRRWRAALLVFLLLAAITAGSEGVKQLVGRPRPSGTDPNIPGVVYSYPSGHVLEAMTILGIITIGFWRSRRPLVLRVLLVVGVAAWVAMVGVARMGLAAHYPSDVLGGFLAAAAALGCYGWFTRPGSATQPDRANKAGRSRDGTRLLT